MQFWAGLSLHKKCIWSVSSRERLDIISYLSWLYGASFDKHQSLFVYLHWLEGVLMHNNDSVCVCFCMCLYVSMCVYSVPEASHLLSPTPYLIFCRRTTVTNLTLPPGAENVCMCVCIGCHLPLSLSGLSVAAWPMRPSNRSTEPGCHP